jgi:sugar O-acyltransferase (sialic acid O-acetyltransferase NeuD family)
MQDLILFPFNGNARETIAVIDAINVRSKTWKILGFIDNDPTKKGLSAMGYPVLGGMECLRQHPHARLIAVPGRPKTHSIRDRIIDLLDIPADRYATLIHPNASIGPHVTLGFNTVIMAGVVATCQVTVGNHCLILPNSVLSHDTRVMDYCLIGSNVSVSGNVTLESLCYVGTGARIIQEVTIGTRSIIGMGAVVLNSVPAEEVWVGCPARFLKRNV